MLDDFRMCGVAVLLLQECRHGLALGDTALSEPVVGVECSVPITKVRRRAVTFVRKTEFVILSLLYCSGHCSSLPEHLYKKFTPTYGK